MREEYPRPQFERKMWMNLNGEWAFCYDDENRGITEKWYNKDKLERVIQVPYAYQCELSGINEQDFHDIVWYSKKVNIPSEWKGKRVLLNFGAIDYKADVWINGEHKVMHEGGHVPFSIEITEATEQREVLIVVRVEDNTTDMSLPRGKQYWKRISDGIFYTRTTGIWQTVWLECVGQTYLHKVYFTPNVDQKKIEIEYFLDGFKDVALEVEISLKGQILVQDIIKCCNNKGKRDYWLDQQITMDWAHQELWVWAPENPVLFDVVLRVKNNNTILDEVSTYFGLRKIEVVDGVVHLNNRPYYQKLLLDQGYWEESLLTAPTDQAFIDDIMLAKEMGFNGVRKHQKIEDPRYLYWADKLGFLVWGEMANAYIYSREYVKKVQKEWVEVIERDYNHPCIIVWTPLNESWGVDCIMNNRDQQAHAAAMYYITKSLDQTRLVVSNDGWEHTETDLLTIHDYAYSKKVLKERYSSVEKINEMRLAAGRGMFARGWEYKGQPIIISEMGGISYQKGKWDGWGYSSATSDEDYAQRYYDVVSPLLENPLIQGFVYTQITDVEQEINGLYTYDRKPKIDPAVIRAINKGEWKK